MTYPLHGSHFCEPKKYSECFYLHKTLTLLSMHPQSFACGESPDFKVGIDNRMVGIEVTQYHSLAEGANGRPRRALEEEWDHLQREIISASDKVPELNGFWGRLEFTALELPERRQCSVFVEELIRLSLRMIGSGMITAKPNDEYPLLKSYLKEVSLRKVGCYISWEWNHSAAFIGLSEDELLNTIEPKIKKAVKYFEKGDLDELWLLVVSEHRLSQAMPPWMLDTLNSFGKVNEMLLKSKYSKVFIFQYMLDVIYEWPGWRKIGEEKFIPTIDHLRSEDG